jgi:hypothetical protein
MMVCSRHAAFMAMLTLLSGCGYTHEEMVAKDRHIATLTRDLGLAREQLAEDKATFDQTWAEVFRLHDEVARLSTPMGCSANVGPVRR